jgi:hypothetical protein
MLLAVRLYDRAAMRHFLQYDRKLHESERLLSRQVVLRPWELHGLPYDRRGLHGPRSVLQWNLQPDDLGLRRRRLTPEVRALRLRRFGHGRRRSRRVEQADQRGRPQSNQTHREGDVCDSKLGLDERH